MITNNTYPKKLSAEYNEDGEYQKKGDKLNNFYIAGGKDEYFEAKMIEFYGIN